MITIVAKNTLKPKCAEEFKEVVKPLIEGSRAESGNIFYDLFEDVSDPNILTFIERWEDEEAIELHNNSKHFTEIIPMLSDFMEKDMDVEVYKQSM